MQKFILGFAAVALAEPKMDPFITDAIYPGALDIPFNVGKVKGGHMIGKKGPIYEPLMSRTGPLAVAAAPLTPVINSRRYPGEVIRSPYLGRYPYELVRPIGVELAQPSTVEYSAPFTAREFYGWPQYAATGIRGSPYAYERGFLDAGLEESAELPEGFSAESAPTRKLSEKEVDATVGTAIANRPYSYPGPYYPTPIGRPITYPPFVGGGYWY